MRDQTLREAKATLRGFFAGQDDRYLTQVADECRSGEFKFTDSCHCIRGLMEGGYDANNQPNHLRAELVLADLVGYWKVTADCWRLLGNLCHANRLAGKRTLPIVLAEIRRRTKPKPALQPAEVQVTR